MPRLESTAPELKRLKSKSWEVNRLLPDVNEVFGASVGVVSSGYLGSGYALDAAYIWQESSQMALGNVLQSVGIPALHLFKDVVKKLDIDVVGEVGDKLIEVYGSIKEARQAMASAGDVVDGGEAMHASVEAGIGFAVQGVSHVPVYGWIVKIVWAVAKLIKGIVKISRAEKNYGPVSMQYPASRFSPELDNMILNDMLTTLRDKTAPDWSRLFGPPQMGKGQGTLKDYWVKEQEGGAKEIYRRLGLSGGTPTDWQGAGWTGMVPGTTVLHRGVYVKGNGASELGSSLMPSTQNVLFWLWKDIIGKKGNAGPAMYTIDTEEIMTWKGYIHGLHKFLYETNQLSSKEKTAVMQMLNSQDGKKVFGWGTKIKPTENEVDKYQPVKELNALRSRQEAFLDSLLVAYIDKDWGAIKGSAALKAKWKGRRRDLLEHPARCDVDLDNVPDVDYRNELQARGAGTPQCRVGPQSFAIATVQPFNPGLAKTPEGQDHGEGGAGPSRGIGYLPLLALGVGAWYAYKKGYPGKLLR